jgi:aspartyl-tRNA(Asn)/glutamyl-tRNA(Gln) amidotransferase subunit A
MGAADLLLCTIVEAAAAIRSGEVTAVDLAAAELDRIDALDDRLHSYVLVTREVALQQAAEAGRELEAGRDRGPLHGIPIALKDLYATHGIRTTGHSRVLLDWIPDVDATAAARLRAAGAVLLGKQGMSEFAFGGYANEPFPSPRNPWNTAHEPGGSSSGSGVGVAAGLCFASLGSDTGGSIRKPASHCGVVGIKPTYGRVSRHGVLPLAWSLDHAGPLTRSVEDAAIVLGLIAGHDPLDPTSSSEPVPDYRAGLGRDIRGLRLGVPWTWLHELGTIDTEVVAAFEAALDVLRAQGAVVVEVDGQPFIDARSPNTIILTSEAYAYHEDTLRHRPELLGKGIRNRLREAAFLGAADYLAAQRARTVIRAHVREILGTVDAILSPTSATAGEAFARIDPETRFREPSFVNPADLLGHPAISVPCGFSSAGLPIGLQIAAGPFEEALVLQLAHAYEQATDWHDRHPAFD